jgi:ABC-type metal ion transport system substrate-binding protein
MFNQLQGLIQLSAEQTTVTESPIKENPAGIESIAFEGPGAKNSIGLALALTNNPIEEVLACSKNY